MRRGFMGLLSLVLLLTGIACSSEDDQAGQVSGKGADLMQGFVGDGIFEVDDTWIERRPLRSADRRAFFGDLHVHTTYSFDAFAFGTLAKPDDAYRFARGEAIEHPAGFEVQLRKPLDFYAVTDHAMFMGVAAAAGDTSTEFSKAAAAKPINGLNDPDNRGLMSLIPRVRNFGNFLPSLLAGIADGSIQRESILDITGAAWRDTIDAAERFNDPGRFTTFVAYEYTSSTDDRGNLHRNVIFKGADKLPAVPFSRFHSQNPEGLWDWMDALRAQGVESLAIPHNSNGSNGQMFKLVDWAGNPLDDRQARQRIRNEPLVEITQVKGTSETHPLLSTRDEWADFEIMPYRVATMLPSEPAGSYVRDALRRGLALERGGVTNPYTFGFVGSTDTHTGASSLDESDYFAKIGLLDASPELRGSVPLSLLPAAALRWWAPQTSAVIEGETYIESASPTYGASGLAAVWAEENSRDAIFEAFRRKETFATSGPRIRLRFFAGYDYGDGMLNVPDVVARAYAGGVAMGGELLASGRRAPRFLVWALADPDGAPLQRLQIVKGWIDAQGETHEFVYDVACAGGAAVDPTRHRCPDNDARVDLEDCSISGASGSSQLRTQWRDPSFEASERAFYYARVLENPTCRWSTWDAVRAGKPPRPDLPKTIQERAWSSPIHYQPSGLDGS